LFNNAEHTHFLVFTHTHIHAHDHFDYLGTA